MRKYESDAIKRHREELANLFKTKKFVVFLCGPSCSNTKVKGAILRKKIQESLTLEEFDVVLGEDEGLENTRLRFGANAQTNEKSFLKHSDAVIIIASSYGTFCELGLFSDCVINKHRGRVDFILILDKKHEKENSYLRHGPVAMVSTHGCVRYVDLDNFDPTEIIERLISRRSVLVVEDE